jgi:hypothetical protein
MVTHTSKKAQKKQNFPNSAVNRLFSPAVDASLKMQAKDYESTIPNGLVSQFGLEGHGKLLNTT